MLYNQHMGGVDVMDQCVGMYPHRGKNKWWHIQLSIHILDVATVNAWHLYRMSGLKKKDLLHFKVLVACALLNAGPTKIRARERISATSPPVKRRAVSKATPEIRFGPGNHWLQRIEAKNANRCHDAACIRKTKYMCMQCPVALCTRVLLQFSYKMVFPFKVLLQAYPTLSSEALIDRPNLCWWCMCVCVCMSNTHSITMLSIYCY